MENKDLTNVEIATIVAYSITFDCEKARRMWQEEYDNESPPAPTLRHWKNRFMETLSLHPRMLVTNSVAVSDEKKDEVLAAFADDLTTSQCKVAQKCQLSPASVNRILKEECLRPWKFKSVQELYPDDFVKRKAFYELILEIPHRDRNFVMNINFSDEATFHVNGSINRHNTFIYSHDNPHAVALQPIRSLAVTCWAMVSPRLLFKLIDSTMTAPVYLEILQTMVTPLLSDARNRNQWYQLDDAPAHYATVVRDHLNRNFTGRWIGRRGPISWSPRSPDLSVNDF